MLASTEGGLSRPVLSGFRPQIRLRGVDFSATLHLAEGQESLEPGQSGVQLRAVFNHRVPIELFQHFEIRQGGKTVKKGEITSLER